VQLIAQLKRRGVVRAMVGYGIVAFALLQIVEPIMHGLHLPDAILTFFLVALALAFPVVVVVSWALDAFHPDARRVETADVRAPRPLIDSPASLALIVIIVAAIAVVVTLVAVSRRATPRPPQPTLTQITFAGGVEEYPAWSPDGKQLLHISRSGMARKVFRKNLQTGEDLQLTHGDLDELQPDWSPDGHRILFLRAHQQGQKLQPGDVFGLFDEADVWQLDLSSGKEVLLIADAFDPAYSPAGDRIAVDASWAGPRRIWILDREGHNPIQVTTDRSEGVVHIAPRWSPDGKKITFQNLERTKYDVRVVDLESKRMRSLTDDYFADIRPVWSPSGRFIYFTSDRSGGLNIWRAPVRETGELETSLQQVTTGAGQDVEVAISPDGTRLAFATLRQNADIWRLPVSPQTGLSTGPPEAVIQTTREESRGAWSPDGSAIAFNSDRTGDMNIWLYSLKDGGTRQLTTGPGGDFQPNWSPDGARIVFFSSRSGTPDIWEVEIARGALRQLTSNRSLDVNPFFSPDGRRIAFVSDRTGRSEVWVMNADGSEARQLTANGAAGHFLRWTNTGEAVIYSCRCGGNPMTMAAPIAAGVEPFPFAKQKGGSHISLSPDRQRIMDVVGHRVLWVSPVKGGAPEKVFEFEDPNARIDYPVWSPDGNWVLFDRNYPQGADIWVMKNFE